MSVQALYQQNACPPPTPFVSSRTVTPSSCPPLSARPPSLLTALSDARRDFAYVPCRRSWPCANTAISDPETVDNVRHTAYFYGGATRPGGKDGWIDFYSCLFLRDAAADQSRPDAGRCCLQHGLADGRASVSSRCPWPPTTPWPPSQRPVSSSSKSIRTSLRQVAIASTSRRSRPSASARTHPRSRPAEDRPGQKRSAAMLPR